MDEVQSTPNQVSWLWEKYEEFCESEYAHYTCNQLTVKLQEFAQNAFADGMTSADGNRQDKLVEMELGEALWKRGVAEIGYIALTAGGAVETVARGVYALFVTVVWLGALVVYAGAGIGSACCSSSARKFSLPDLWPRLSALVDAIEDHRKQMTMDTFVSGMGTLIAAKYVFTNLIPNDYPDLQKYVGYLPNIAVNGLLQLEQKIITFKKHQTFKAW